MNSKRAGGSVCALPTECDVLNVDALNHLRKKPKV